MPRWRIMHEEDIGLDTKEIKGMGGSSQSLYLCIIYCIGSTSTSLSSSVGHRIREIT